MWVAMEWGGTPPFVTLAAFSAVLGAVFLSTCFMPSSSPRPWPGKGATALLTMVLCFARWQQGSWGKDDAFSHTHYLSLSEQINDGLSWTVRTVDLPLSFEALVELAIEVDNRMQEQEQLCKTTGGGPV